MENEKRKNPWLGLESYAEGETLYGRDYDIQELTQSVLSDKDTLLYGKSGIGKSSILNAGVIPAASRQGYLPVPVRLDHKQDKDYLAQICEEIVFQLKKRFGDVNGNGIVEVLKRKNADCESIYEYFHRHIFLNPSGERIKLLIVLDQFEEIFTLQESEPIKKKFFAELADFLNDITPRYLQTEIVEEVEEQEEVAMPEDGGLEDLFGNLQIEEQQNAPEYITDNDIHFVFTIREDFLSEFEYYTATIPSLKHNRYGLRPLNEEQAAQIILHPIPGLVSLPVAKLIIEKVTNKTDFDIDGVPEVEVDSAVLSLYMNRLYEAKSGETITTELVEEKGNEIIKQFYYDAIANISPDIVEFLETRLLNSQNRRENITEYDAIHEGQISKEVLKSLCDGKLKILRKFYLSGDMRIEFIHDILCPVIKEHKEERIKLKREEEERIRQEEEKKRFIAIEQAKREKVEREAQLEQLRLKEEANQIRLRTRKRLTAVVSIVIAIILVIGGWYLGTKIPYSQNYASFIIVYDHPEGVGQAIERSLGSMSLAKLQIFDNEKNDFSVLYKLTRRGILPIHKYERVEVIAPNGQTITNMYIETPVVGLIESELNDIRSQHFANLQKQVASWDYRSNTRQRGGSATCTAFDRNKKALYSIQYYRDNTRISSDTTKYTQWAVFYDGEGKSMMVSDKGTDRMRQTVRNGVVTGSMFFTELGVPQQDAFGAYGYLYEIDSTTNLIRKQYNVNKFGDKINNTAIEFFYDKYGRIVRTSAFNITYPQKGMVVYQFEQFCDTLQFAPNGFRLYGTFHAPIGGEYSLLKFKYDEYGRPLMKKKYIKNVLVESTEYSYIENRYDSIAYYVYGENFVERYSYPNEYTQICSLWKQGKKCEMTRMNEVGDAITYHLCKKTIQIDSIFRNTTWEYLDLSNKPNNNVNQYAKRTLREDTTIHKPLLDYCYLANGDIYKSAWYDYDEYGREIARAVAGIEGTPVRCPDWDWDDMCYYKVSMLEDNSSSQIYVAVDGYDEFGDEAYIINEDGLIFSTEPMSMQQISEKVSDDKVEMDTFDLGLRLAQTTKIPLESTNLIKVPFLHLINKKGTMYIATSVSAEDTLALHPKDGDVLVRLGHWRLYQSETILQDEWKKLSKNGGTIEILRAEGKEYVHHSFTLVPGTLGANYYVMPIKQTQQERIKNAIKK